MNKIALIFTLTFSVFTKAQYSEPEVPTDVKQLKFISDTFIKKDGSSKNKVTMVKKIETDSGRMQVALTKVNFYKSQSSFKLIEAYTLNGAIKSKVDPKKVIIRNADKGRNGLSDMMEAVVPFDNITVGGEVHLIYEVSNKSKDGNYFSDVLIITNEMLAKEEKFYYTSEVPLKVEQIVPHPYFTLYPLAVEKGLYGWGMEANEFGRKSEGVDIQTSTFAITTLQSWEQFRKIQSANFDSILNKALPKKYEQIVESAKALKNPKEVIEKVAHDLAKAITYAGNWQTQKGKFVPQDMEAVASKGTGDCKDYTTAMVAILRKLNFTANPFLTFRSPVYAGPQKLKALTKLPVSDLFNHVIVYAKDSNGKAWWIDPTNPYVQADVITYDILGNFGILLDEKSTDVTFLPDKNSEPANMTLLRTIVVEGDNSIGGKAIITMTASSHNTFGMVERMYGQPGLAKTFGYLLNPSMKTTKVEIKKTDVANHKFEFDFFANDWMIDQKKYKALILLNPLILIGERLGVRKDIDLGEPGVTKFITKIKNKTVADTIAAGCLVRGPAFNFDRIVENTPEALIVTDELNIKKRFISKDESQGREYEVFLGDVSECLRQGSTLVVHSDPSLKSPDDLKEEKKNGPLVELLTDKQADDLYKLDRIDKSNFLRLKLARYYQSQLKKKPTAELNRKIGNLIINLGYISGDLFGEGYMEDGLSYYEKALSMANEKEKSEYLAEVIDFKIDARKVKGAILNFNEYYKANPKKFKSFSLAAKLAAVQYKDAEAESWLKVGERYAQTNEEKISLNKAYFDFYYDKRKYKEAIPFQEKLVELKPDAWSYHNLAVLHLEIKNYDKVIELETKALELMEFGMAKNVMSSAYLAKFIDNSSLLSGRTPASDEQGLSFLHQAIKYDANNADALGTMALFQARECVKKQDKTSLSKGKNYLDQAMEADPTHFKVRKAMEILKDLEDGKKISELSVTGYMVARMVN